MQGTVVMLMALSGLGCHHKGFSGPVQTCYSSCYSEVASGCYSAPAAVGYTPASYVAPSCYSECYSSCYSAGYNGCYASYAAPSCAPAPRHRHGLFGLCGRKRQSCGACGFAGAPACYGTASMYGNCYSADAGFALGYSIGTGACYSTTFPPNYAPAVFGTSMPIVYGSSQGMVSPQSSYSAPTPAPAVAPTSAATDPNAGSPAATPTTTEPKSPPPPAAAPPTDPVTPPPPAATPPAAEPVAPTAPAAPATPAPPAVEKPKT